MTWLRSRGAAYWLVLFGISTGLANYALSQDAGSSKRETHATAVISANLPAHPLPQPSVPASTALPAVKSSGIAAVENKKPAKTVDRTFLAVTGYSFGSMVLDVESTRNAIANCGLQEKNPLYGSNPSRAKLYAINVPLTTGSALVGYWLKKKHPKSKAWMILPFSISGAHTFGYINNFAKCAP